MSTGERPLLVTAAVMTALALVAGAALLVDPRTIDGAPAWLKPAKFAVSTAVYSATLAWIGRFLPDWPRVRRAAAWTTSVVFFVEVALIVVQAARGTSSHFNTSTALDASIFAVMGAGILLQTVAAAAVTIALWRQPFTDRALGLAIRFGMTIAVVGAFTGGLMTRPTSEQLASARATHTMPRSGAHTVGAPDGGAGLPGTGWSVDHGDLRVPHFVGLHSVQLLPLALVVSGRRRSDRARARFAAGSAALYAALFVILLAQALAGQSLIAPQGAIAAALVVWASAAAVLAIAHWRGSRRSAYDKRAWRTA